MNIWYWIQTFFQMLKIWRTEQNVVALINEEFNSGFTNDRDVGWW